MKLAVYSVPRVLILHSDIVNAVMCVWMLHTPSNR